MVALAAENAMDALKAPPRQLTTLHTTIPYGPPMESYVFPSVEKIAYQIRSMVGSMAAIAK